MTQEQMEKELKGLQWTVGLLSLAVLSLQKHAGLISADITDLARQMLEFGISAVCPGGDEQSRTEGQ
jgi:hypothetical protein